MFVAQVAPAHPPSRLPMSGSTTIDQCGARSAYGTESKAGWQRSDDHDQVHRFVQDDGL
jgi:hypothetical protein